MSCIEQTYNFLSHITNANNSFLVATLREHTALRSLGAGLHLNHHSMKKHISVNHEQLEMVLSIGPTLIRIVVVLVAAVGQAEVFSWLQSATMCHKILYTCLLRQLDDKCWLELCFGFI